MSTINSSIELTILMPCLNEAETLSACISKALSWIKNAGINGEVLIADNGSTDGSQEIARSLGAVVVNVPQRGYGSALYYGSLSANGRYVIMGDSDDSYDFSNLGLFVDKLRDGYDLVMGNRFKGGIKPGAMPWKNRYIGNPVLTGIGRILFGCPAGDFHCGLRGYSKDAFMKMDLRTSGMEFASEMIIKANIFKMRICEVPTTLSKDGRSRPPHLRPWRDGWRHLRFMLLFSPRWLFLIPGLCLSLLSLLLFVPLCFGPISIGTLSLSTNSHLLSGALLSLGVLSMAFGFVVRMFGAREGLFSNNSIIDKIRRSPALEIGGSTGFLLALAGLAIALHALGTWTDAGFGELTDGTVIRSCIIGSTLSIVGGIIFVTSLTIGFLSLPIRRSVN